MLLRKPIYRMGVVARIGQWIELFLIRISLARIWVDIQAKVQRTDAMGKGTDGDEVDSCRGDIADAIERDAPAGFDEGATIDLPNGGAKVFNREVIQ